MDLGDAHRGEAPRLPERSPILVVKRTLNYRASSREVSMLHLCENHLDPMGPKFSIYSHEKWIHVESLLMKYESMSLTQISHLVKS